MLLYDATQMRKKVERNQQKETEQFILAKREEMGK